MVQKIAAGGIITIVLIVGLFVTFKESSFIQGNPYLARVASISLSEASTRFEIWGMALEGIKERPILGWGQGNYNYVFNQYYKPSLYAQEAWFDRVHNIVMDWLIAGGILGLLAYFSILVAAIYYLFVRPLLRERTGDTDELGLLVDPVDDLLKRESPQHIVAAVGVVALVKRFAHGIDGNTVVAVLVEGAGQICQTQRGDGKDPHLGSLHQGRWPNQGDVLHPNPCARLRRRRLHVDLPGSLEAVSRPMKGWAGIFLLSIVSLCISNHELIANLSAVLTISCILSYLP